MSTAEPIVIPPAQLSPDALAGLIESFINREGTDYGDIEWTLAQKTQQVERQLQCGEALIVFDPLTESCTIVPRRELALALKRMEQGLS
jgi:uncharacterized protein YheU (UPF0270 family)